MKKEYINPEMMVVKMETQRVLADSMTKGGSTDTYDASEFHGTDNEDW